MDVDELAHAAPQQGGGTCLCRGAQSLDVLRMLAELENELGGREPGDSREGGGAGFHVR